MSGRHDDNVPSCYRPGEGDLGVIHITVVGGTLEVLHHQEKRYIEKRGPSTKTGGMSAWNRCAILPVCLTLPLQAERWCMERVTPGSCFD